jgi:hypothetical protein
VAGTGCDDQVPLPFEVRTTACPVRALFRTVEVDPTAVQAAVTAVGRVVGGVQSTALMAPIPGGTVWGTQVVPSSSLASIEPTAWDGSTVSDAVAQQWRLSVQARDVATDAVTGSRPPAVQAPPAPVGVRVVTLPETVPRAVHRPLCGQATAVTSVVPAGTGSDAQVVPELVVVRMAPGPTPVPPTWPTAVHARDEAQAMPVR